MMKRKSFFSPHTFGLKRLIIVVKSHLHSGKAYATFVLIDYKLS